MRGDRENFNCGILKELKVQYAISIAPFDGKKLQKTPSFLSHDRVVSVNKEERHANRESQQKGGGHSRAINRMSEYKFK